ncbi:hypothetical protein HPB48_023330 [Haemaphysalis longicornis]|uniref:Uncharacterized protein n=1 Tax=Haemaphysalis longicornis TaxID=44386 RepID=A0A9J6H523_HAELO|nr:hypothetical protein HPB48_023330 [Haemaphysalis longicornis]
MARRLPTIRLAGISLLRVKELKVLGVVLDPWFTCMPDLKTKIEVVVLKITAFNMHYKFPPDSLRRLYVQLVEPVITYASPAWWSPSRIPFTSKADSNQFSAFRYLR